MNADHQQIDSSPYTEGVHTGERTKSRKLPYGKPELIYHGDLRSLTLFGSFDSKDSGLGSDLINP